MTARLVTSLVAGALVLIAALSLAAGSGGYGLSFSMASANGLRQGAEVRTGGVPVGRVTSLSIADDEQVEVSIALDEAHDVVHGDATARVVATNLVGEKYVELDPGASGPRLESGARIPSDRIGTSVDLDEVLDVLDADTRTRLGILINETGFGLTGRRTDFNAFLGELPPALDAGRRIVDRLVDDNHTLGNVVGRSDRLVTRITAERRELRRMVNGIATTASAIAAKRAELRATLAEAPGALGSARALLGDLERATGPLGPAARLITDSAPPLADALEEVDGFEKSARPALRRATSLAPELTRVGTQVAPVLREAVPTARALGELASTSTRATRTLGASIDDLLGLAEGWSRSIQLRDGLSHVFRGRASISVDTLQTLTRRLVLANRPPPGAIERKKSAVSGTTPPSGRAPAPSPAPSTSAPPRPSIKGPLGPVIDDALRGLLPGLRPPSGPADRDPSPAGAAGGSSELLDFLLGP